jgi:hypothetical protein
MRLTPLSAYERETIIVFNDAEELATITTHQRRILTKLERNPAAEKMPEVYRDLVRDRGWTPERFQDWLERTLAVQLISVGGRRRYSPLPPALI